MLCWSEDQPLVEYPAGPVYSVGRSFKGFNNSHFDKMIRPGKFSPTGTSESPGWEYLKYFYVGEMGVVSQYQCEGDNYAPGDLQYPPVHNWQYELHLALLRHSHTQSGDCSSVATS